MSNFFNLESPLMQGLNKMADLIILNLLTLFLCLPVITAGASLTAMHYVVLKIVRDEETYIIKSFFKSFKDNFKQATVIWIIHLFLIVLFIMDFKIVTDPNTTLPGWMGIGIIVIAGLVFMLCIHTYSLLAKFENPILATMKNSALVGLMILPKTVLMVIIWILPVALMAVSQIMVPISIMLGITGPAFLNALLYNKTYKKFEPSTEEKDADAWSIPNEDAEEKDEELEEAWASLRKELHSEDKAEESLNASDEHQNKDSEAISKDASGE